MEVRMNRLETIAFGLALAASASPAFAVSAVPAPVAGVGIGAVLLIGAGYRAIKTRIK
jgi:hypothetical protein